MRTQRSFTSFAHDRVKFFAFLQGLLRINAELRGSCHCDRLLPRVHLRELIGMYRVAAMTLMAVALQGCSMANTGIATGFADLPEQSTSSINPLTGTRVDTSTGSIAKPAKSASADVGVRVAALPPDKAPAGSYEKAPRGALTDRDYTATALNPEIARDLINQYRHDHGLKPLKLNPKLTEAAKEHSRDLSKWDRISHYGSDGSNPWDRVKRTGYNAKLAAENVGTGQISFDEVLKGWKESPGHNKNLLLSDAHDMGLALVQDPKTEFKSFWTLVIGTSM